MTVLLDTSPLRTGHAHRGIGQYTAQLLRSLRETGKVTVVESKEELRSGAPDLVHYPYFDLFTPTLPLLKPAKKCVVTIHDVIPLEFKKQYQPGRKGALYHHLQKISLKGVNAVITDSIYSKNMIAKHLQIDEKKIFVVYLAGNPEITTKSAEKTKNFLHANDLPAEYILYVGDINYNKNIPQLIKSLRYLPDTVKLVLAGKNFKKQSIPEWHWIETQIALSNVAGRVIFANDFGEKPMEYLSNLYSGARCYVQPSLSEGFGLPVLEAMQASCPVVCSDAGSLPEVGGHAAVYCEPTAEDMAAKINKVLSWSAAERREKIQNGTAWANKFTWETVSLETLKVYETVYSQ